MSRKKPPKKFYEPSGDRKTSAEIFAEARHSVRSLSSTTRPYTPAQQGRHLFGADGGSAATRNRPPSTFRYEKFSSYIINKFVNTFGTMLVATLGDYNIVVNEGCLSWGRNTRPYTWCIKWIESISLVLGYKMHWECIQQTHVVHTFIWILCIGLHKFMWLLLKGIEILLNMYRRLSYICSQSVSLQELTYRVVAYTGYHWLFSIYLQTFWWRKCMEILTHSMEVQNTETVAQTAS